MIRAALFWIFVAAIPAVSQMAPLPPGTEAPPNQRPYHLNWDWRRNQELTWEQSLRRTQNLSEAERSHLLAAMADQLSGYDFQSEDERKKAAADARIKLVALGRGGNSDFIVQAGSALCSPTGNCTFWILRRRGNLYTPLLETEAQTFTLQRSRNNGLLDIVLTRHSSASESEVKVYKFDGKSYKESGCYMAEWAQLGPDGEFHKLKAPKLTACNMR
jgi:hypothetical protein